MTVGESLKILGLSTGGSESSSISYVPTSNLVPNSFTKRNPESSLGFDMFRVQFRDPWSSSRPASSIAQTLAGNIAKMEMTIIPMIFIVHGLAALKP